MGKLKIYKASAGSGKTHTLTREYLKLASLYPDNFKRILAVTFTNKAAEEMKQRILEALNEIILKGQEAPFYSIFSSSAKENNEKTNIIRARNLRDSILHDYSYFSLSTIDSFVQKVIKSFTYEIGIESGYRIELDTEKVLTDLTELLYKQIDTDSDLKTWLIHFANFKMDEGKNWDFRTEIHELAREIFKEQFQADLSNDNEESDFGFILDYFELLNSIKQGFEEKMERIAAEAKRLFSENQVDVARHGMGMKSLYTYLTDYLVNPKNQDAYLPVATVSKLHNNPEAWSNKTAKADVKAESLNLFNVFNPLLTKCLQNISENYRFYLSAINILSAFHAFGILRKLAALLPAYRNENNLLLISDTTRILKEIIAGNDAPFIYEKIGNRYKHVLIDEFQDTSGFQWENFKPLIDNGLSEGNENLIVGDIKQSIYRWRGGDWSILMSKIDQEIGSQYINHQNLDTNWRSKKNILDFNNSIFTEIPALMQKVFDDEFNEGIDFQPDGVESDAFDGIISKAYADVCQKLPDEQKKAGGRVKIQFFVQKKGDKKEDIQTLVAKELPLTIEKLLTQKNYQPGDIAILVRRNAEGKEIANLLLDYQQQNPETPHYQIISSESLMLVNSPLIQVLINAMYVLHNHSDSIHLHALIASFLLIDKPENQLGHEHFNAYEVEEAKKFLAEAFFSTNDRLSKLNVFDLSEELIRIFRLGRFEGQLAYLQTFQDIVLEFGQNSSLDLATFLEWWEEKGKTFALQLADQQDAVKIISIHKSKGLAFKIVLIPYCDWELKPQANKNNIIWTSTDIEPFNRFSRFPVIYRSYLKRSIFWKEYYTELLYTMIDALNMLYVAFTRPKEELIIFAPVKESAENKFGTVADYLRYMIKNKDITPCNPPLQGDYFPESEVFELKPAYNDVDGERFLKQGVEKSTFSISEYATGNWNEKISFIQHAEDFFVKSIEYIQQQIDYGTLMHHIFSKIDATQNIKSILDDLFYSGKIGSSERQILFDKVYEMISRPMVADWFSDKWTVKTEDAILDVSGKIRIPDRVLIGKEQTLVIDFKFGKQYSESHTQVKEYMELLNKMGYPGLKGFIYYAEKNVVEEVK